jgi:hypothetical protein
MKWSGSNALMFYPVTEILSAEVGSIFLHIWKTKK